MNDKVDSTSNERTLPEYRLRSDLEKAQIKEIKDMGLAFINHCNDIGKSREMSLAITKAEEAVMWAVKHITK